MIITYCLIFIFSMIDFIATSILISRDGFHAEMNPLLLNLMQNSESVWAMLAFKIFTLLIFGAVTWIIVKRRIILRTYLKICIWACTAGQILVAMYGMGLVMTQ